jgi:hypothetical protein
MSEQISNPIGEPQIDGAINNYVAIMTAKWTEEQENIPWWKFWKSKSVAKVTKFLLGALDELIAYVDQLDLTGPDKKATVLAAVSILYDYVIREALPIWAKPFASKVKQYIVYALIASAIDWIVEKYRNGVWVKKSSSVLAAQWSKEAALLLTHNTLS